MKKNKKERLEKKGWSVGDTDDFLNDETLEEVMASDFPRIYIHGVKDSPDETCNIEFSTNKAFDDLYKKKKDRKRVSKKGIGNYILELLKKSLAKEDGYDLKRANELYK